MTNPEQLAQLRELSTKENASIKTLGTLAIIAAIGGVILAIVGAANTHPESDAIFADEVPDYGQIYVGAALMAVGFWIWVGLLFFWAWRHERRTAPPWTELG